MSSPYPNGLFSTCSFLGFLMSVVPFPWHFESWNTGTCLYMAWAGISCMNQFVNSVSWNGNVVNWSPVWCDISSRIIVASNVAIPASSLCIQRRLYKISAVRSVTITKEEKRRLVMEDLAIGLGLPFVFTVLQYIPQGHRFDIWEDIGCFPFTYDTIVGIFIVHVPPVVIGFIAGIYAVLTIRNFVRLRTQFQEILAKSNNLSQSRYLRLMILSTIEVMGTIPLGILAIVLNAQHLSPWISWADTHSNFSDVRQIPASFWRGTPIAPSLEFTRWMPFVLASLFFLLFGFAEEARKNYKLAASTVAKYVGVSTAGASSGIFTFNGSNRTIPGTSDTSLNSKTKGGRGGVPVFVKRDVMRKHDSLESFSDGSDSYNNGGILSEKNTNTPSAAVPYDSIFLPDVGGALADSDITPPNHPPAVHHLRPCSETIEVSSLRYSTNVGDFRYENKNNSPV